MNLHKQLTTTVMGNALVMCELARELEEAGEYVRACGALGVLWCGLGVRPQIDGLPKNIAANVLLRVGWLTNWMGSASQIYGAQESAHNLLSEAARYFEELGDKQNYFEAKIGEANCYWRVGAHDEGRVIINQILPEIESDSEIEFKAILTLAIIAQTEGRFDEMLRLLSSKALKVEKIQNSGLKGKFHNTLGLAHKGDGNIDRALEEYSAASYYFKLANHLRYQARVENNLGVLLRVVGRYTEALKHLKIAREIFVGVKDKGSAAQVDESFARVHLEQENYPEAIKAARSAVEALEQGEEYALLVEALTTLGTSLSRAGELDEAIHTFSSAYHIASDRIGADRAGQVGKTLVEELAGKLFFEAGVTFDAAVFRLEHDLIKEALRFCDKNITAAAFKLGMKNYQTLQKKLSGPHQELLNERAPIVPRKRSVIINKPSGYKPSRRNVARISDRRKPD